MAQPLFTNNAATTLASGITNSSTTLTVASGTGALFPSPSGSNYSYITLINTAGTILEIVKLTARTTDTFTIVRAQEGTAAAAFNTGDKVELRVTAAGMADTFNNGGVQSVNGSTGAVTNIATAGANSNITSLSGLTTPLTVGQGGTGNTTGAATAISNTGGWSITPSGTKLNIIYNGVTVASIDSSGNLIAKANVTAYGTP